MNMQPKRLYKSKTNRVLFGVCGGLGEYFNIDPTIFRLIMVLLICGAGSGLLAYIVAAIIIPEEY
jgi:phage shock protein C